MTVSIPQKLLLILAALTLTPSLARAENCLFVPNPPICGLRPLNAMMLAEEEFIPEPPMPDNPDGPSDPNNPLTGQVENFLNAVPDENSTAQQRETAEDQLVALGRNALNIVRDAAARHTGAKHAVAEVAAFRIQHGLKPRDVIAKWSKKNVDGIKSKNERISEVVLGEVFANHLFYIVDFGPKAKLPAGITSRIVLAIAADGKAQIVSTDEGLTKFLRSELAPATSAGDRGKIAEVALILACAREPGGFPKSEDITTSEDASAVKAEGANKSSALTVSLKFDAGKPASVSVKREAKKSAPEKPDSPAEEKDPPADKKPEE